MADTKPPKSRERTTRKAKVEKHRGLMESGLKAEIKFNAAMAEKRMAEQEEQAKRTNEAFAAKKLAEKMAKREKEMGGGQSLGEGLLMAVGLDGPGGEKDSQANGEKKSSKKRKATEEAAATEINGEADGEGKKKSKKRKAAEDAIAQVNGHTEAEPPVKKSKKIKHSEQTEAGAQEPTQSSKKEKRRKTETSSGATEATSDTIAPSDALASNAANAAITDAAKSQDKADRKQRKKERKSKDTAETDLAEVSGDAKEPKEKRKNSRKNKDIPAVDGAADEPASISDKKSKKSKSKSSTDDPKTIDTNGETTSKDDVPTEDKSRFIAFIGNLPFTATAADLSTHLQSISPDSVRLQHKKGTKKSKGFAFVEFATFDKLQTCLKKFHHSNFDDGKSAARKINVELTAGGGGAGKERKEKIKEKNDRLAEERAKDAKEAREKRAEEKVEGGKKGEGEGKHDPMGDVHPSRRARMA